MQPREQLGQLIGRLWAPAIAAIARARHARMFHAVGRLCRGRFHPSAELGPHAEVANQLGRSVLVRCSPALSKRQREWFDVLGVALRFHDGPIDSVEPADGDQDLLFATIRSPFTMAFSPFVTDAHDYLGNRYWAVSPFALPGGERVELRLDPARPSPHAATRDDRLAAAIRAGAAWFTLRARRTLTRRWEPLGDVELVELVADDAPGALDQERLRFDPFRAGAGLEPVGTVHAIRRAAYAASQRARPRHGGA